MKNENRKIKIKERDRERERGERWRRWWRVVTKSLSIFFDKLIMYCTDTPRFETALSI